MRAEGESVESQLDAIFSGGNDGDLAKWVTDLVAAQDEESKASAKVKSLKAAIIGKLHELGSTGMIVAGRRIGLSTRAYYGIDKEQLEKAQKWIMEVAPEAMVPASTNVAKAVEVFMERNPDKPLPDFILKTETETFTNAKAK